MSEHRAEVPAPPDNPSRSGSMAPRDEPSPARTPMTVPGVIWLMVLVFLAALLSPVDYSSSDARGTLLTAQAMAQTGTLRLDRYMGRTYVPSREFLGEATGKYRLIRGHCYYSFPVGTALAVVPFVWLANLVGADMVDQRADAGLQNLISAILVAVSALLACILARCFVRGQAGLMIAAALVFGGPLTSTMGTALWSSDFATALMLCGLVLLARHLRLGTSLNPWLLGILLGFAILCRPTASVFSVCALVLLATRNPRNAGKTLVGMALTFLPLCAYSLREFKHALPDYYIPLKRLPQPTQVLLGATAILIIGIASFWRVRSSFRDMRRPAPRVLKAGSALGMVALLAVVLLVVGHDGVTGRILPRPLAMVFSAVYGSLLSPSRGLLVFCPYLLIAGLILGLRHNEARKDPLLWLAGVWLLLQLAIVARPSRWHGGHCYGPRMFAEAFPAAMVITLVGWEQLASVRMRVRRMIRILLLLSFFVGIFMHTYQGLFNMWTARWNGRPNIDQCEQDLFEWRYAQFLASPRLVERRQIDHETAKLPLYSLDLTVSADDSATAYFLNWTLEPPDEWGLSGRTDDRTSEVWFVPGREVQSYSTLALHLAIAADSRKQVIIAVNGKEVELLPINWRTPVWHTVEFPGALLRPDVPNEISFEVYPHDSPSPKIPTGVRLWKWRLSART